MLKKISLVLVFYFFCCCLFAQHNNITFPEHFVGNWKGVLQWVQPGKASRQFIMQLNVAPVDTGTAYSWTITYGDSSRDLRPYILKPVDKNKGHWLIDELNGSVLDNYVAGNCLQGSFTVLNNTIVNNYCIEDGRLKVEFFTIKLADKKASGNGTTGSPTVNSYRMAGYQYGLLEKLR